MSDKEKRPYHPVNDLSGQVFGRWTVLGPAYAINRRKFYFCRCQCGNSRVVKKDDLLAGKTKSCGCNANGDEKRAKLSTISCRHGMSHKRLHRIWSGMKTRCDNANYHSYNDYGGRGITVCEEWRNSFEKFRDWALAHGYADGLSIDRINNDGNYEPGNCRWATAKEQRANQRPRKKKN